MKQELIIDTKEYVRKLEQLQHGTITMEEWRKYCDEIRNSIAVDRYLDVFQQDSPDALK